MNREEARAKLLDVIQSHRRLGGAWCDCGWVGLPDGTEQHDAHVLDALLSNPQLVCDALGMEQVGWGYQTVVPGLWSMWADDEPKNRHYSRGSAIRPVFAFPATEEDAT